MRRLGAWAALFPALAAVRPWLLIDSNNVRGRGREARFDMSSAQFLSLIASWAREANSQAGEIMTYICIYSCIINVYIVYK